MTCHPPFAALIAHTFLISLPVHAGSSPGGSHYTEPPLFSLRPIPDAESDLGCVGGIGLMLRAYPGVIFKVENELPGCPAAGKSTKGELSLASCPTAANSSVEFRIGGYQQPQQRVPSL